MRVQLFLKFSTPVLALADGLCCRFIYPLLCVVSMAGKVWLLGVDNLTSELLHCKLQIRFLVREGAFERRIQ
jgi:hypothetical protein